MPVSENVWVGVDSKEVLFVPLFGSPKFHPMRLSMNRFVLIEKSTASCRQLSDEAIMSRNSVFDEQSVMVIVLNKVSVPHASVTMQLIKYVPVSLNWCVGLTAVEVLFVPLFGSPKFQFAVVMLLAGSIVNNIKLPKQVSPFVVMVSVVEME